MENITIFKQLNINSHFVKLHNQFGLVINCIVVSLQAIPIRQFGFLSMLLVISKFLSFNYIAV